eukprot:TRINITY_DN321_c0_g2_i1.p1 TRINITY_DN321_c0_g2~~TRINITY_DN321_c0_g2_i1.p1  ORF type:complete len:102 (-),score=26.51 TRINITY_DN321_c0_g2_i1:891-1196(-)
MQSLASRNIFSRVPASSSQQPLAASSSSSSTGAASLLSLQQHHAQYHHQQQPMSKQSLTAPQSKAFASFETNAFQPKPMTRSLVLDAKFEELMDALYPLEH